MPTKKRISRKSVSRAVVADERKADKELNKLGLNTRSLVAAVITLVGAFLLLSNLTGILLAFVGMVLIYFGLKMFGIHLRM
jgi:hypothetical protein